MVSPAAARTGRRRLHDLIWPRRWEQSEMTYANYGEALVDLASMAGAQVRAGRVEAQKRSNHTGTQPASTISDFTAVVDARIAAVGGGGGGGGGGGTSTTALTTDDTELGVL